LSESESTNNRKLRLIGLMVVIATATTLKGWAEQAAELQVLRADKANRDLRRPGLWKLDKANSKAVQKNLLYEVVRWNKAPKSNCMMERSERV
jgi:hypothetical protein